MRPVIGLGMVGISVVLVYGGITGRLAPMLAALFYPQALIEGSKRSGGALFPSLAPGGTGGIAPGGSLLPPGAALPEVGPAAPLALPPIPIG